jgi:creatinine amidohydrolase
MMSRRSFTAVLVGVGLAALLAACAPTPSAMPSPTVAAATSTPTPTAKSAVNGGYSIFEGTMVELPWTQVEKAAKEGAIVLLPTAVIEEHGPHMGLGIDAYESYLACQITRRYLGSRGVKVVIAPPLYWGINVDTGRFPGSFSMRPETLKAVLYDLLDSLHRWGFSNVFVLNTHGDPDHNRALAGGIEEARKGLGSKAYFILTRGEAMRYGVGGRDGVLIQQDPPYDGPLPTHPEVHAGAFEVGMMVNYFPGEVDVELAKTLQPTNGFEPLGYWGDPAGFNAEASKKYFEAYYRMSAEAITSQLQSE